MTTTPYLVKQGLPKTPPAELITRQNLIQKPIVITSLVVSIISQVILIEGFLKERS